MRSARWFWGFTCFTLWSCGGRYEVGEGAAGGAGGASGATSVSVGSGTGNPSATTGSPSTTVGTTGAGGSGVVLPAVTNCVMKSMKACSGIGCHSRNLPVANLNLTFDALTTNYKTLYYDKPNAGIVPADPMYCSPNTAKLVDSANPTESLIYRKILTQAERSASMKPPCGEPMPAPPNMATAEDKMCVLQWITDVIAGSQASR